VGFWTPGDYCSAIFARLELAGLHYLAHFAGESPAIAHAYLDTLCPSIAAEWDWLAVEYIRKTCRSFCRHRGVVAKKNEV
jgi:hypothetical protein